MANGKVHRLKTGAEMTAAELAEWDADIEAEYQRVVAAAKTAGRKKRGQRLVGFPFAFLADVCRLTEGRATLVVAALIYRRTHVCGNRTVTLPSAESAELGIDRLLKRKPLSRLAAAGLIRIETAGPGQTVKVTLLWREP
jgi:hypothetical protein